MIDNLHKIRCGASPLYNPAAKTKGRTTENSQYNLTEFRVAGQSLLLYE